MLRERFTTRKSVTKAPKKVPRAIPQSLMARTGFLLSRCTQFMRENMDVALREAGITCRHYGILAILGDEGSQTQHELGEMLLIDRSTIVDLIDQLEKLKWVTRLPDPNDRRAYQVTLTPKGVAGYEAQRKKLKAQENEFLSCIPSDDLKKFQEMLTQIFNHQLRRREQE